MKVIGLRTHIWKNNSRSLFMLVSFPFIIGLISYLIMLSINLGSDQNISTSLQTSLGMLILFSPAILGGVCVWFTIAWIFHKQMILAMTDSKPLERKEDQVLYDIVQKLCISRGLPMPKIYIIEDDSMNAFASGLSPKNAIMSFSRGILNNLTKQEIEAVAAHELTHIINRDIRVLVISIIFVGIIQTLSEVFLRTHIKSDSENNNSFLIIIAIKIVVFIIGYLISMMIQLAISRRREYMADAGSVELTKSSEHLISALEKISQDSRIEAIGNKSVAQMCIENPLEKGETKPSMWERLFSTHPPISDRIDVLRQIG